MREYQDQKAATDAKTARLRALRLAKEKEAAEAVQAKPKKRAAAKSAT